MFTLPRVTLLLRIGIIALFALLIVFETLSIPGQFIQDANKTVEDLALTLLPMSWAVSLQVALVVAWRMLTFAQTDAIFTQAAIAPMSLLLRVAGYVVTTVGGTFLYIAWIADDPGAPMVLLLLTMIVTVAWLVVFVLRDVLTRAVRAVSSDATD